MRGLALRALGLDLLGVLLFAAIGRRSHAEGLTAVGVLVTAWPFAVGTLAGWSASRGWRAPTSVRATGAPVWLVTVALGMLLRRLTGAGTAVSFVIVATIVLAVLLIGWRAVTRRLARP